MKLLFVLMALVLLCAATISGDKVVISPGTAALPAITFKDDTDTGLYSLTSAQLGLSLNGVLRHTFVSDTYTLTGSGNARIDLLSTALTSTDSIIRMGPVGDEDQGQITYDNGSVNLIFRTSNVDGMRLNSGGLLIENMTQPILRIDSNTDTGSSIIEFGDASDNNVGMIRYDHSGTYANQIQFHGAATIQAKVTSSGLRSIRPTLASTNSCIGVADGDGLALVGYCSSSKRYKKDIVDLPDNYSVDSLRPVRFNWKSDGSEDIGLIAEEVNEIMPAMVTHLSGKIQGVRYNSMVVIAFAEIKRLKAKVATQELAIDVILNRLSEQESITDKLSYRLAALEGGH